MLTKYDESPSPTIPFFPAGLPDETIGSRVSRYHIRRGRPTMPVTFRQLFDRSPFSLTNLVQPHLDILATRLPGSPAQNLTRLRAESTLLPLYQRFLGSVSKVGRPKKKHGARVEPTRRINGDSRLTHICRQCLVDDEREYGFPYIHRAHQIPGVTACWKHAAALLDRCPACRQPFAQPTQLVLSAWMGCDCGHLLFNELEAKEKIEPSDIEVDFARFARELLEAEPIKLRRGDLVQIYKMRAAEIGFGWGREQVKRTALFESVETFFGSPLLSTIDSAYRSGRVSGWIKVIESSAYDEAPLHRHLLLAYFLFRDPKLFLLRSQSVADARVTDQAQRPGDHHAGTPESREAPDAMLKQMVAVAQRYNYDSHQLWRFYSGGMKRLVKMVPNACELIDARLRAASAKKKRSSGRESEFKERDRKSDIEWAKAIKESAMKIYAIDERPYRVTMNKLVETAKFRPKGVRLPSQARFPLARAAAEEHAESGWHFFARRMLWTLQSLNEPSTSPSMIIILSGLELHKGKAVLQYFSGVPRCGGASAKEINAILEAQEIDRGWSGPCPEKEFYRAGRAYQPRTQSPNG